jgi:hypothetical protein
MFYNCKVIITVRKDKMNEKSPKVGPYKKYSYPFSRGMLGS